MQGVVSILAIGLMFGGLLIYGYTKEKQIIAWEQKVKKIICQYIYNKIVAFENWRVLRKAGVKEQDVINALFEKAYHYYDGYKTAKNLIGDENHELVKALSSKCFACFIVIKESGLGDLFLEFVEEKQKNNRVSGN